LNNQIKTNWNIIRHETGKSHLTEQIPSLLINNEKVKDPKDIVDAFNTFFLTITENLNFHQEIGDDAISFLREIFPGIKTIPTTETEIKSKIHSLKTKISSGYDGLASKIIKGCASLISNPLTHICNHSLSTGIFPDHLKISIVRPLYRQRHTSGG
jgi:hypothetical protein